MSSHPDNPVIVRAQARFLASYLRVHPSAVALLACLLTAGLALALAGPQMLQRFIDAALAGSPVRLLTSVAGVYVGIAFASQLVGVGTGAVATDLGLRTTNHVRRDLTRHVMTLDLGFHHRSSPGELIERVDGDVAVLQYVLSTFAIEVVRDVLLLIGALVLMFRVDALLGLTSVVLVLVIAVVLASLRRLGVSRAEAHRQAYAELTGYTEEHLAGTEDVRANGAVEHVLLGLLERGRTVFWTTVRTLVASSASRLSARALFGATQAVLLGLSAWLTSRGRVTVGEVYLVFAYTGLIALPVEALGHRVAYLHQATASLRRVTQLAGTPSVLTPPDEPRLLPEAQSLDVEWDAVTFAYGSEPVVRDVTLRVSAGRTIGVLGRTGSGKSTLVRLLPRLYDPSSGSVRLGGVSVANVQMDELRSRVAFVTQDVQLFSATVRQNVTLFDDSMDGERVRAALRDVGLGDWLASLDDGLESTIDPHGMSAGEAQLLAFARALVRDPAVIVLDEASSKLDLVTERRLELATAALLRGRTAIVIAHRLSTLAKVDDVAVLADGRLVEYGDRNELAADPRSMFAQLLAHDEAAREVIA